MNQKAFSQARIHNLDAIRAFAMLLVLLQHSVRRVPTTPDWLHATVGGGLFGLEWFFVLSGYLIGGLWWREYSREGKVNTYRFILRRMFRSLPPYFAVLPISWLAVYADRQEPFNWRYLTMTQNYLQDIPYFVVSWSLCIEEHFYLVLPFLLLLLVRKQWSVPGVLLFVAALPMVFRAFEWYGGALEGRVPFGYVTTATHLRYEGLILGVLGAWLSRYRPGWTKSFQPRLKYLIGIIVIFILFHRFVPEHIFYVFGYTTFSIIAMLTTGVLAEGREWAVAGWKATRYIALSSYSIYLAHPLCMHAALRFAKIVGIHNGFAVWILLILATALVSPLVYFGVERTSMRIRDRVVPDVRPQPLSV